ncbi:ABC transporter permease [Gordonia soli]|uniref:Transport permease protein n=1 Tax=Gordonia soli NBRC 108243 TaxID=1223545 RepID=M0QIK5_9ACTN|nr:ABC transporter permease [Gordonia soli]GAC67272.1 putative ABC transporter permease protein [Gordonia soli NBRC 108243]
MTTTSTAPEAPTGRPLVHSAADSVTMVRRSLRRMLRYPSMTVLLVGMPVVFLLLFVFVFGGQLGSDMVTATGGTGRSAYLAYVVPGILLVTIAAAVQGTAITVAMDMTSGIIARFRTMDIGRTAVLSGHVIGSLVQTMLSLAVVFGVAVALGFRPHASAVEWIATIGLLALFAYALIWLAVLLGLRAKSVETASNTPMFLTLLPFMGSSFVPADSMPMGLRQFAEYQPFTPVTETLRGLLTGSAIGTGTAVAALAWSVGIAAVCLVAAQHSYSTRTNH